MSKITNDDKKLVQMAMNGWRQFFHYFWRGKWRMAYNELKESKEQIRAFQKKAMNIAYGEKVKQNG